MQSGMIRTFTLTRKKYSTIFSGITDTWYRMDCMAIPEIYEDLFIIGISVFAIDKRVSRRLFPDCWTRELSVSIPVLQMSKWHGTEEYWNQTLGLYMFILWRFRFLLWSNKIVGGRKIALLSRS